MTTKRDLRKALDALYTTMRAHALANDRFENVWLQTEATKRQREDAEYDVRDRARVLALARDALVDILECYLAGPEGKK